MVEAFIILGLTVVLTILKLFHIITWNWWWVIVPLWLPMLVLFVVAAVANTIFELMECGEAKEKSKASEDKQHPEQTTTSLNENDH